MTFSRRHILTAAAATAAFPQATLARAAAEITWDDLIPPGVPYSEIIAEGFMDERNDVWRPQFDENATKLNPALDGAYIKMPGFIIPMDLTAQGVSSFILVPYMGACIHTPPPPPNQLVFVTTTTPWSSDNLWDAVWVTGQMQHELQTTEIADTGYLLEADLMEIYVW